MGHVAFEQVENVGIITFETPGKLNAFTRAMRAEVVQLLGRLEASNDCIGAVLTGAGEAFCAGQDFNESSTWDEHTPWVEEFEAFARGILSFKKPLVAAVNGVAAGGGFQAALMCDSRIGHAGVRMGQPEVKTGLASVTGTWLLMRSVGDVLARELVLSGRLMDADELVRLGLLSKIVAPNMVVGEAAATCRALAESPSDALARTKTWVYNSLSDEIARVFADAAEMHKKGFASGVSQAGARRFLEARNHKA